MIYLATSINESPTISEKAGAVLADVRGRAVKFNGDGKIVLAGAGDTVFGVGIMTNDVNIQPGADVDIQMKDIGAVYAGAPITKGSELSAGADGVMVPASSGAICAIALESAETAGVYIRARLVSYTK